MPAPPPVAARLDRLLDRMRDNPRADWSIEDVRKLCRQAGVACTAPTRGSHYKVSSPVLAGALTIPAHRPVKSVYIKRLVVLIDAHVAETERKNG